MDYEEILKEIVNNVLNDDEWEYPKEEREMMLWDLPWTLLNM